MSWFGGARRPPGAVPPGVRAFHAGLTGYGPTPLTELPAVAAELGVGRVLVKDESQRLGLPAFKVLGVSWAVHRLALPVPSRLVTATDGNHGRALARTARVLGHHAHVVVPRGIATAAILGEGARVTEVDGDYDEAVRAAALLAAEPGSVLVQDTAWPGYEQIPGWIVDGYSTLFVEIDEQLGRSPDLVVVPVGVGSLAQAAVAHGGSAVLSVEPDTAACLLASLRAGRPVSVPTASTVMAGLNCPTVSTSAWPLLRDGVAGAVAVSDAAALTAVDDLAALGASIGPSGAATLAGARVALPRHRAELGLDAGSTVVLLGTESAPPR